MVITIYTEVRSKIYPPYGIMKTHVRVKTTSQKKCPLAFFYVEKTSSVVEYCFHRCSVSSCVVRYWKQWCPYTDTHRTELHWSFLGTNKQNNVAVNLRFLWTGLGLAFVTVALLVSMWTLCRCGTENVEPNIRRMSLRIDEVTHILQKKSLLLV